MSFTQNELYSKDDIEKETLESGIIGDKPIESSICHVILNDINIIGPKLDSQFITSASNGIEQTVIIGECDTKLDRKFEKLLETMLENEHSAVKIQITENSTVTFKIHLVKLVFNGYFFEYSADKKCDLAQKHKARGVELYKENRIVDAFYRFSKACRMLQTCVLEVDDEVSTEIDGVAIADIKKFKLVLFGNLASCQLKVENYEAVISLCSKVLAEDSDHVKSLYKRGLAYAAVRDFENSEHDLMKFLNFEPDNKLVQQKLIYVRNQLALSHERFVNMCKRMF